MILKCCLLKKNSESSRILRHVTQFSQPHLSTFASVIFENKFAFVRILFPNFVCWWLLIIPCVSKVSFKLGSLWNIGRFLVIMVKASSFMRFNVDMNGSILGIGRFLCWHFLKLFMSNCVACLIPSSKSLTGHCLSKRVFFRSCSLKSLLFFWQYGAYSRKFEGDVCFVVF